MTKLKSYTTNVNIATTNAQCCEPWFILSRIPPDLTPYLVLDCSGIWSSTYLLSNSSGALPRTLGLPPLMSFLATLKTRRTTGFKQTFSKSSLSMMQPFGWRSWHLPISRQHRHSLAVGIATQLPHPHQSVLASAAFRRACRTRLQHFHLLQLLSLPLSSSSSFQFGWNVYPMGPTSRTQNIWKSRNDDNDINSHTNT